MCSSASRLRPRWEPATAAFEPLCACWRSSHAGEGPTGPADTGSVDTTKFARFQSPFRSGGAVMLNGRITCPNQASPARMELCIRRRVSEGGSGATGPRPSWSSSSTGAHFCSFSFCSASQRMRWFSQTITSARMSVRRSGSSGAFWVLIRGMPSIPSHETSRIVAPSRSSCCDAASASVRSTMRPPGTKRSATSPSRTVFAG